MLRIGVDFDGTIVSHEYPAIGKPVQGAIRWLRRLKKAGAVLILWTMRSDDGRQNTLTAAVEYCREQGLEFDAVNEGIDDRLWTSSPKVFAHVYVDDAAFGCPCRLDKSSGRPVVNWARVGPALLQQLHELQESLVKEEDFEAH